MEERFLTPENSRELAEFLISKRSWTMSRIARVTSTPRDFIHNVLAAKQSFETRDVEALAKACRENPFMLLFQAAQPEKMTREQRGLYELAKREVARHEKFQRVLRRKPAKRGRPRTTKAA